jgi:hypothetical protein
LLGVLEILNLIEDIDTSSSGKTRWLADPEAILVLGGMKCLHETRVISRECERLRIEVIDLPIEMLHLIEHSDQAIFLTNLLSFGEMVYPLVTFASLVL